MSEICVGVSLVSHGIGYKYPKCNFKSDGLHNFISSYGSKHFIVKYPMLHIFQIAPENHANIMWYAKISAGLPLLSVNWITKICWK